MALNISLNPVKRTDEVKTRNSKGLSSNPYSLNQVHSIVLGGLMSLYQTYIVTL